MTDAELGQRLDLLRAKGVQHASWSVGPESFEVVLGPLPVEPRERVAAADQKEEPLHPADLVAAPEMFTDLVEPEGD